MKCSSRYMMIRAGLMSVILLSSGCHDGQDIKQFSEIGNGLAKGITQLGKEQGVNMTGFASDPNKKIFKVGIGIDHTGLCHVDACSLGGMEPGPRRGWLSFFSKRRVMMDLTDFPVQVKMPIAEGEMGSAGHVKNIYYVRYFECARNQYVKMLGLNDLQSKTGIGTILAQTICKYLKPLAYPDQIIVGAKVKSMGKSSFVMEYIIVSERIGVSATGEEVIVIYDYNNSKKAELPLAIKAAIEKINGLNQNSLTTEC